MLRVEGIGCVMRECREEVRLGMTSEASWSRVMGRSLVEGRTKEEWSLREGAMTARQGSSNNKDDYCD